MTEQSIAISSGAQIPACWGVPQQAVRKASVAIREPVGAETFVTAWGTLRAEPGLDWVIVQDNGEAYPVKKAIFACTYELAEPGRYRKTARSRLVQVPAGVVAVLTTLEGSLEVCHPDYVAIGEDGEVYANAAAWVAQNLEFV